MAKKEEKTNVMRTLDQKKIAYIPHAYDPDGPIDGVSVARTLGQDPACVFKTLVTRGASGGYYVFDIPAAESLDLKKAARAVGEKSVAMLPQKELLPLTGYVHGGCSPVGMKKQFPTVFHRTAADLPTIMVSAKLTTTTPTCVSRMGTPSRSNAATSLRRFRGLPAGVCFCVINYYL